MSQYSVTKPQMVKHSSLSFLIFLCHFIDISGQQFGNIVRRFMIVWLWVGGLMASATSMKQRPIFVWQKNRFVPLDWIISALDIPAVWIYTLRPRQNGRRFTVDTFKRIFLNENVRIAIKISVKFVPMCSISNIPELVQIMAWPRPGDKPLSEPMVVNLLTHECVTRPQWVNIDESVGKRTRPYLASLYIYISQLPIITWFWWHADRVWGLEHYLRGDVDAISNFQTMIEDRYQ